MGSTAEAYHRLTKYSEENLRSGPGLDWSKQPEQFKDIVSSSRVSLRSYMKDNAPKPENGMDLARIGRLLFYSNGVTGVLRVQSGDNQLLRAAPSAGALYPTEIYVALRDMDDVEAGLYNYQARSQELVRLWEGDQMQAIQEACGGHPIFESALACLLLTGVHWRSAWRYQERGYRRVLLDTGHVAANAIAYAPHEGCAAYPIQGFCDGALNGMFFFDDAKEAALLAVPILKDNTAPPAPILWTSRTTEAGDIEAVQIQDEADLGRSAAVTLHRASCCGDVFPVEAPDSKPEIPDEAIRLEEPGNLDNNIPVAIVQRRSARGYTGEPLSVSDLGRAIAFAFGRDGAVRYGTRDAGILQAHLVVFDVSGLESGLYRVAGRGDALVPVDIGDFRDEFFRIALGQEIARACGAILILTAPAKESVEMWGDRAYRHLHMEAGMLGERFQLAATALGLGACGIAGFLDDDAATAVHMDTDDFVIYLITVGHV